jgi:hypothetical protein
MREIKLMALATVAAIAACSDYSTDNDPYNPPPVQGTVVTATGDITAKVDAFRNLLGPPNGGTAGEQPAGRREINWDGAGANPFNNKDDFPADFFNTTVKAGALFTTAGTGFRNDSTNFTEINPAYATEFNFFSANKIFAPVGSNQLDQLFRVAGESTPAAVRGFGIVFSDVDRADATTIQLFALDGSSLGTYAAPVRSDAGGLSFVGVTFDQAVIARVRITLGTGALAAGVNDVTSGGTLDLVVLDNVIYGEPTKAL